MSNLEKIESFCHRVLTTEEYYVNKKQVVDLTELISYMRELAGQIGDAKLVDFFRSVLSSMIFEATNEPVKNIYLKTLNRFNAEMNIPSN